MCDWIDREKKRNEERVEVVRRSCEVLATFAGHLRLKRGNILGHVTSVGAVAMSAVVCGKRSLFDDLHGSPPIAKRIRCGGNSPIRFQSVVSPVRIGAVGAAEAGSPGRPSVSYLEDLTQLRALYPEMDGQLVERVYDSCGRNLDSAIKSLTDLRLSSAEHVSVCETGGHATPSAPSSSASCAAVSEGYAQASSSQSPSVEVKAPQLAGNVPADGAEWVDLLVREMMGAVDLDDARLRATRALEAFEKIVASRAGVISEVLKKENISLKEQIQGLLRDNHILKRAVAIQHERQVEHEERSRELQAVKQLLAQHQEQLRMLEVNNYALTMHLRKAQEGSSIPAVQVSVCRRVRFLRTEASRVIRLKVPISPQTEINVLIV
ncbi:hypothetical protein R1flu_027853 [Riccia fluitans]|uniref:CUE domain-containing protein n=1 Tax=Riccia fluitans TaxID=41844 RepID=A0ABD1XKG2_9MARC